MMCRGGLEHRWRLKRAAADGSVALVPAPRNNVHVQQLYNNVILQQLYLLLILFFNAIHNIYSATQKMIMYNCCKTCMCNTDCTLHCGAGGGVHYLIPWAAQYASVALSAPSTDISHWLTAGTVPSSAASSVGE
jgi:hypothetical protein